MPHLLYDKLESQNYFDPILNPSYSQPPKISL